MPWETADAKRKMKIAKDPIKAKRWSTIANSVLKKTGDEKSAIRIASSAVRRMRGGGAVKRSMRPAKIT